MKCPIRNGIEHFKHCILIVLTFYAASVTLPTVQTKSAYISVLLENNGNPPPPFVYEHVTVQWPLLTSVMVKGSIQFFSVQNTWKQYFLFSKPLNVPNNSLWWELTKETISPQVCVRKQIEVYPLLLKLTSSEEPFTGRSYAPLSST
jgi:hypothetical protein